MEKRLTGDVSPLPFTLPAEAVLDKVIRALESPKPKPRYYVTFPTHLFGCLKRLLPTQIMDFFLAKAGDRD